MKLEHLVTLEFGDISGDGHDKRDTVVIRSSLNVKQLEDAYRTGAEKCDFSPIEELCADYEDNRMSLEQLQKLKSFGFDENLLSSELVEDEDESTQYFELALDDFKEIVLFVVALGNPSFQHEEVITERFDCGGYGLYF